MARSHGRSLPAWMGMAAIAVHVLLLSAPTMTAAAEPLRLQPIAAGRWMGPWREVARGTSQHADGSSAGIGWVGVHAGGLVSVGWFCPPRDANCRSVAWRSTDGLTWDQVRIPGRRPQVADIVPFRGGLVAVGYVERDGAHWRAAVWSTPDGTRWQRRSAPDDVELHGAAVTRSTIVAIDSDYRFWTTSDLSTWRPLHGPPATSVVGGADGLFAYRGGGQDIWRDTRLWRSRDGRTWLPVRLTRAARLGSDGVTLHRVGSAWVLVTEQSGPLFASRDGRAWRPVPRPAAMVHGAVWVVPIGEDVVAWGDIVNEDTGLWTWKLGRHAPAPLVLRDAGLGRPFRWQGDLHLVRYEWAGDPRGFSLWRLDPEARRSCAPLSAEQPGASRVTTSCRDRVMMS